MATTESLTLSTEQRDQFERDGYVVIDPGISDEVIENVKRELDGRYITEGPQVLDEFDVKYRPGRNPAIQEGWKIFKPVREVALAPKVLDVLRELYAREPYPSQTINFPYGSEQHAHADGMLFNSFPMGYMCGVWLALEDVDMENGPLVYYPGSHKLPIPEAEELGDLDPEHFNSLEEFVDERSRQYSPFVKRQIEENDLQPRYGTMKKGQALVWAANLLHGGSPQKDPSRTRHSQVTHYYFEGDFKHFGQLQVVDGRKRFDYPVRIEWDTPPKVTPDVVRATVNAHIAPDQMVVIAHGNDPDVLDLQGRTTFPFPEKDGRYDWWENMSPEEAIESLERRRSEGASYLVVPGLESLRLPKYQPDLQHYIEDHYKTVLRDRGTCVIFALE